MKSLRRALPGVLCLVVACLCLRPVLADPPASQPVKVYVPYEKLKGVFESEKQGVFLPLEEFQRLWRTAEQTPAGVAEAPTPYLISTSRFTGTVGSELASMQLELTVDILSDKWVHVPIGLGDVAVAKAEFAKETPDPVLKSAKALLQVQDGQYFLLTKGKGRRTLVVDFVRQLVTQPGLNVLGFKIPSSAITTLELTIPEENMKVDVEPMLAASTEQVDQAGKKATRLRAFLGSSQTVKLSWKPKTQAAAELAPVVISDQFQHIHVAEALISHEVKFTYDIRRRGVDSFTIQLPANFRVTAVEGDNISKWDIAAPAGGAAAASAPAAGKPGVQNLTVQLFSPAKDTYALTVKMELFIKDAQVQVPLTPILTQQVLRGTGLIAITHSPRRSVELTAGKDLARVDTGRLPEQFRSQAGATAWRFISPDYAGTLVIDTVSPRVTANHLWAVGADSDRLELRGQLNYTIERTGLFQLTLNLPEPWKIVSLGPADLVDDHQLAGAGPTRTVNILLKREVLGTIRLDLVARADRTAPDATVDFALPLADAKDLRLYSGQVVLYLADQLRAEVDTLQQLQSMPLKQAGLWANLLRGPEGLPGLSPAMAFEFRAIDRAKPASAKFKIAVKPTQISAVVNRLVNIQPGSVEEQALVDYRVLYAPVDTLYLKMPAALADAGVRISGPDIKEKPRIDALPADQREGATVGAEAPTTAPAAAGKPATAPAGPDPVKWAYYKIVLQGPVQGNYRLTVDFRRSFQAGLPAVAGSADKASLPAGAGTVVVEPILAAGKLSDQTGYIAVAKAETLAIGEPKTKNLIPGDPSSPTDMPEAAYRNVATLAFRYNAPPFELSLPVAAQKEAAVFTTIATGAIIEQVLGRDGTLNTNATFLLATSRGDRLAVTLPPGAEKYGVLLNGAETPIEAGASADEWIVRLPPSAGQVAKLVLTISYGLKDAKAAHLVGPHLAKEIPVQQTLWRLRTPAEEYLLWFDNVFSQIHQGEGQLNVLAAGYPGNVQFKFANQGQASDFLRQGEPGELRVLLIGKETFSLGVWAVVLVIGILALWLSGFQRCVLVLLAALAVVVAQLVAPLLARQLVVSGLWAGVIVLGLWMAHWVFKRLPRQIASRAKRPAEPAGQRPMTLSPVAAEPESLTPPPARPEAPPTQDSQDPTATPGDQDREE